MLIHPKFVYAHLPKTAGSYIESCLIAAFPDAETVEGQHVSINEIWQEVGRRVVFGSIRNPLEWYTSRFFFGKDRDKNLVFTNYDLRDYDFKTFIRHMTSRDYQQKHPDVHWMRWSNRVNDYKYLPMFEYMSRLDIGLYTFEYIYSFFNNYEDIFKGEINVFQNHDTLISLDRCIRCENVLDDLVKFLTGEGYSHR